MTTVTVYYSADDVEFFDREECLEHEVHIFDMCIEFLKCVHFYNESGEEIWQPYSNCLEECLEWIDEAFNNCEYIKVKEIIPIKVAEWIKNYFGFCFPESVGFFEYIMGEGWRKVDE